jgi:hypothetical protein
VASPIPRVAPVTRQPLPLNSRSMSG